MGKSTNGIKALVKKVNKIKKSYKIAGKSKNIVIKLLSLAATGYSLFTMVEPFLNKDKD